MSRYKDTDEYRIKKITITGDTMYLCEQKVLCWYGWNPWAKKPSGYYWTTVNNQGRGAGFKTLDEAQGFLVKHIERMKIPDGQEVVFQVKVSEK